MATSKMTALNSFVQNKTAIAPEQPQRATRTLTRQQVASMKVSVPVTRANSGQNRQANIPVAVPTRGGNQGQRDDTFGTDYTGSTVSNVSKVLVEDSQIDQGGKVFADYDEKFGGPKQQSEEGSEEGSGSEHSGDEYDDEGEEDPEPTSLRVGEVQDQRQKQPHINTSDKSYPTTTSGRMDEEVENEHSSRGLYEAEQPYQQQQRYRAAPIYQHAQQQQPAQQFHPVHELRQPQQHRYPAQPNIRQSPPQSVNQPLIYRQSPPVPVKQERSQNAPQGGLHRTQFVSRQHHQEQAPAANHHHPSRTDPARTKYAATPTQPAYEAPETPVLDYEPAQLGKINYDELQSQSYDHDPSPHGTEIRNSIGLDERELSKPLPDRLSLVQKLASEKQAAFFASIPLDEWEDAGEWFLEQFGEIVKKMGEARKEKRSLAQAFESEILKRHEAVDSNKRDIDEALSEMKNSGDQVLLRGSTPKKQKTPAKAVGGRRN